MKKGKPFPLGPTKIQDNVQFAISLPNTKECKLNLYLKGKKEKEKSILLDAVYKTGSVFSIILEHFPFEQYEYCYEVKEKEILDPYAKIIIGRENWGKPLPEEYGLRCGFDFHVFDWEEEQTLNIPYEDSIFYQIHVRGFTKHTSSKVKYKGTFEGVIEKIPYLKELGINGLVLMPSYEFDEIIKKETDDVAQLHFLNYKVLDENEKTLREAALSKEAKSIDVSINYWGYSKSVSYFAPKVGYAADKMHPTRVFKELVKKLHQNNIELIMEMHFTPNINRNLILDCLRYWVLEYHVDGFRVNEEVVPTLLAATDPILCSVKLLAGFWDMSAIYQENAWPSEKKLAEFNDDFMIDIRKFLKGDEGIINAFLYRIMRNPNGYGIVNYISKINGFTLHDMVSYDRKHNEENGENGKDGTDYNYSWNCGVEGKTRKKVVVSLRKKQMRNAIIMLFLSQGTPMILSGDEFCNSANGNNNPYCQDNEISWLNWNWKNTNEDMFQFTKQVIALRNSHKVLHMKEELHAMDSLSSGYPDISFHGTKAWYPDFSNHSRVLGIMLCGVYAKMNQKMHDVFFYFAYNMHWEAHIFALPKLPNGLGWQVLIHTGETILEKESGVEETNKKDKVKQLEKEFLVGAREIYIFISRKAQPPLGNKELLKIKNNKKV